MVEWEQNTENKRIYRLNTLGRQRMNKKRINETKEWTNEAKVNSKIRKDSLKDFLKERGREEKKNKLNRQKKEWQKKHKAQRENYQIK